MKYCIVQGFVHPRLCEDLSHKNIVFYDVCDSEAGLPLIKNLMSEILNPKLDKDIRYVMENFFKSRAIHIDGNNIYVNKILEFFDVFEEHYLKKIGLNFYLVRREGNKIVDVLDKWQCERESITSFTKKMRNRKNRV
tara:strand:+ start:361 stop:771 length:411 start_codon:yes stop_codon:yes gene_type:complete